MELVSLNCASCSASLEGFQGKNEAKCSFCGNITQILRPIKVAANATVLAENDTSKFNNLISIMERSMIAGNYQEAYDYCNKALEYDPTNASLWENKAICSFWLRSDSNIIESEAKEILTYLISARQANPNSSTYTSTARSISSNLYFTVAYRYYRVFPDASSDGKKMDTYTFDTIDDVVQYLKIMALCFEIYPEPLYLETPINELSDVVKICWTELDKNKSRVNKSWANRLGIDPIGDRDKYIGKIRKIKPDYQPPAYPIEEAGFSKWGWFVLILLGLGFLLKLVD